MPKKARYIRVKSKAKATGNKNTINITIGKSGKARSAPAKPKASQQPIVVNVSASAPTMSVSDQILRGQSYGQPPANPFNQTGKENIPYQPATTVVPGDIQPAIPPPSFGASTTNAETTLENTMQQLTDEYHELDAEARGTLPPEIAQSLLNATAQKVMERQAMIANNLYGLQQARNNQQTIPQPAPAPSDVSMASSSHGSGMDKARRRQQDVHDLVAQQPQAMSADTSQQHSFHGAQRSKSTSSDDRFSDGAGGAIAFEGDTPMSSSSYVNPFFALIPNTIAGNPMISDSIALAPPNNSDYSVSFPPTPAPTNAIVPSTEVAQPVKPIERSESSGSTSSSVPSVVPNKAIVPAMSPPSSIRTPPLYVRPGNRYGSRFSDSTAQTRERERSPVFPARLTQEQEARLALFDELPRGIQFNNMLALPESPPGSPVSTRVADTEVADTQPADTEVANTQPADTEVRNTEAANTLPALPQPVSTEVKSPPAKKKKDNPVLMSRLDELYDMNEDQLLRMYTQYTQAMGESSRPRGPRTKKALINKIINYEFS